MFVSLKWRNFDRYFEYKYSVHSVNSGDGLLVVAAAAAVRLLL